MNGLDFPKIALLLQQQIGIWRDNKMKPIYPIGGTKEDEHD